MMSKKKKKTVSATGPGSGSPSRPESTRDVDREIVVGRVYDGCSPIMPTLLACRAEHGPGSLVIKADNTMVYRRA